MILLYLTLFLAVQGPLPVSAASVPAVRSMSLSAPIEQKQVTAQMTKQYSAKKAGPLKNNVKRSLRRAYIAYKRWERTMKKDLAQVNKPETAEPQQHPIGIESYLNKLLSLGKEQTLTERFGEHKIHSVLDIATGDGQWMRDCRIMPWIAPGATVIGFELEHVVPYEEYGYHPREQWNDLTILTDRHDQRFPCQESVDLVHIGFLDMSRAYTLNNVLSLANATVRPGGWLMLSHNSRGEFSTFKEETMKWLVREGYSIEVYNEVSVPHDYPLSFWWKYFSARKESHNYLIIARKPETVPIVSAPFSAA